MQELRPQAGGYGFERAFSAAQVTVERCEHGPQVGRQRGRPHQQAQACLEAFACTLGVLKECLHLHAEFL